MLSDRPSSQAELFRLHSPAIHTLAWHLLAFCKLLTCPIAANEQLTSFPK